MAESNVSRAEILEFVPEQIERIPESPGVFRILSAGQKVIFIGTADDGGLRDTLWELYEDRAIGGASEFTFTPCDSPEEAADLAREAIRDERPIYNIGFGRFRNDQIETPKQGGSVRREGPDAP